METKKFQQTNHAFFFNFKINIDFNFKKWPINGFSFLQEKLVFEL